MLKFHCAEKDGKQLTKEFSEKEIKDVLFLIPSNKAPGPDGYTGEFLKETWSTIGKDFVVAVQSLFLKGFILKGINTTILALIPKKREVNEMKTTALSLVVMWSIR